MFPQDKISLCDIPTKAPTSLMFGRWGEVMGGFECFDTSLSGPLWRCDRHFYLRLWNITLCHMFFGWSFMWKWRLRKSSPKLLEEFEQISVREIPCWFQSKVKAIEQTLLNGDRGEGVRGGGGRILFETVGKIVFSAFFWSFNHNAHANFSFTCEHHYKLVINTFLKYSFCRSACKAEKTVYR